MSFIASVGLGVGDGFASDAWLNAPHNHMLTMIKTWIADFRFLSDQVLYGSIILFVGARFFEARAVLSIGFDRVDATRMAVHGPDKEGFIWVGRKYDSHAEGAAVVAALRGRIDEVAIARIEGPKS